MRTGRLRYLGRGAFSHLFSVALRDAGHLFLYDG